MNELSWLIYAADVAGSIDTVSLGGIVVAILCGGCFLAEAANRDCPAAKWDEKARNHFLYGGNYERPKGERPAEYRWSVGAAIRGPLIATGVCIAVAVFTPGRETLYAIAASEMGERALASETGGKAVQALNAWLDRQIAPPPASQ